MPKVLEDEKIFQAVIQVVADRGYSGATTRQMADAADISEVTLFRKYGSKQNLVKQAISSIINLSLLGSAAQYTGDIKADLLRIVNAYQDSAVKHGGFISVLFSEMSRHPELVESIDEPLNIYLRIAELLARYQEEGQLHKEPPLHTLAVLLGPVMYSTMMSKAMPGRDLPPFDLQYHLQYFLEGRSVKK